MNFLTKKSTRVFISVAILSSIQIIVGTANTNAQSSEVDRIDTEVRDLERRGDDIIRLKLQEEQRHISGLSCPQLSAEAQELTRQGNYWSAQNTSNSTSRASGAYASAQRRSAEYSRRCR